MTEQRYLVASTRAVAEARAERIRTKTADLLQEVVDAYNDNDYLALGYSTWAEYCAGELDGRVALPRIKGDRVELVKALSEAGMSQRAVADATGMSRNTVSRYVNPPVAQIEPPRDEARQLTDNIKAKQAELSTALQNIGQGNTVFDVLCDPWIIRAIQLESVTPAEVALSALRRQNNQQATTDDEHVIDLLITGLLTRTGRWIAAFNPNIPLPDIYQKEN